MIILGIDPGLATMGYGVIAFERGNAAVVDYGVVTTPKDLTLPQRLNRIEEGVIALIALPIMMWIYATVLPTVGFEICTVVFMVLALLICQERRLQSRAQTFLCRKNWMASAPAAA